MPHIYSDPTRESEPFALPDVEVFEMRPTDYRDPEGELEMRNGWYWWACFPGCLPDGDANGPFKTEAEATADAQETQ